MSVFKIIIVRQVTERVWLEIPDVESSEAAIAAYQAGEGCEVYHKHLTTDSAQIEEVYQEMHPKGGYDGPISGP